jgi:hypothetical protein
VPTLFERLSKERPSPSSTRKARQLEGAQKLLDWLQRWNKDTVTVRDIHIYGPNAIRGQKTLAAAKILIKNGWLAPIKPHGYNGHKWKILKRPSVIAPNVDS